MDVLQHHGYIDILRRVLWTFLFVSFLAAFFIRGNLTHFTWWSLLWFVTYCLTGILKLESGWLWFFLTTETIVIGGVCLMSFNECKLFSNTEHDVGTLLYFFGNFGMHYFPLLAAVALTRGHLLWNRTFYTDISDIWTAFGLILVYFGLYNPSDVYACTLSKNDLLVGAFSAVLGITGIRCLPLLLDLIK